MRSEKYWVKALDQTHLSIINNGLFPLKTTVVTREYYNKNDFIIRELDTSRFKKKISYGPKNNPFNPWDKILEVDKIGNNKVNCVKEGKDRYKRILAECFVNNESLSSYLVRSGYAFAYRKYSKKFIPDEEFAKSNKLGMWSMEFDYPWDWRKKN